MPEMDGYAFIRAIRKIDHLKHTPAIALSGYASNEDQKKSKQAGFDFHVSKPVSHDDFIEIIAEACEVRPY
jgi:two-component system CheB/CheR fusion protein